MNPFFDLLITKILPKTWEHIELTMMALLCSLVVALPLGILLAKMRSEKKAEFVLKCFASIQTVPGLALIALIVVCFNFIRPFVHLPTTGALPSILALVLYAFFPLVTNTYQGIKHVNPTLIEVAKGMGMKPVQSLFFVELPLALPSLLSGIRVAIFWLIGMVTLTSLVGSGGLGDLIMLGLRMMRTDLILAGTIPAMLLALLFDVLLSELGKWLSPKKIQIHE